MAEIELVAIDLDGTLLNSDDQVSPENSDRLRKASGLGIRIVFATTRSYHYVVPFCQELGLSEPLICSNGAEVYASPTGPLWRSYTIPIGAARKITRMADESGWELSTTVGSVIHWRQREGQKLGFWKPNIKVVRNSEDALTDEPLKIIAWQSDAIERLGKLCRDELRDVVQTAMYYSPTGELHGLGIFHPMANKGDALLYVLKRLSINQKNVMAIGDNPNDLAMFSVAGIAVAMGNGTEAVKKQAEVIAPSNDDNGVSWVFDRYVLSQYNT